MVSRSWSLTVVAVLVASAGGVARAGNLYPISPITQCEGSTAIKTVEVENCKDSSLCQLIRGKNHTVRVTLTAPKDVVKVKVLLTGVVGGAELPFPGLNRNLCTDPINAKFCPQKKGEDYTANINMPILKVFPKIKTTAFVRFVDDDASTAAEEKIACFQMPVELIDDPDASSATGTGASSADDTDDDE